MVTPSVAAPGNTKLSDATEVEINIRDNIAYGDRHQRSLCPLCRFGEASIQPPPLAPHVCANGDSIPDRINSIVGKLNK